MPNQTAVVASILVAAVSILGCSGPENVSTDSTTPPTSIASNKLDEPLDCELRLEFPPVITKPVTLAQFLDKYKIVIRNKGSSDVTLVDPGEGSFDAWRTPVIGWSALPAESDESHPKRPPPNSIGPSCIFISALRQDEVFVISPDSERTLTPDWTLGPPIGPNPGKYRVRFYYSNDPELEWKGRSDHDETAMRKVRSSTAVSLVSNEVIVELAERGITK